MNIYLCWQTDNDGYDTFDALVVVAKSSHRAKQIHPYYDNSNFVDWPTAVWANSPRTVKTKLIGLAKTGVKEQIILKSFNAG